MKPLALAVLTLVPSLALADVELGRETFLDACADCHGVDAKGGGPKAALLSVKVPDLTTYAARNGGDFDAVRMIHLVDGRAGLSAHGGPMPMFGGLLAGPSAVIDGPDGTPVSTTEPIMSITEWLKTVQVR
ncbi:cytochrome c [Aliiruegeria haliotis]|uniref:Cytochrome c n=1 Tax=Aliiruegeria haliotis TaxID=1280846 RepID=A0A2T0RY79_9RHOB|nr:cytochrome c [Aliiruegeria haliotis]PRY26139.1 cytochrome c [Aliiruegeria haliotis]